MKVRSITHFLFWSHSHRPMGPDNHLSPLIVKGGLGGLGGYLRTNPKGISVLFLIIAMLLMITIGYIFSYLIPTKHRSVAFSVSSSQALFLAQSGVEFAVRYAKNQGWATPNLLDNLDNMTRNLGSGRFTLDYDSVNDKLTSTGEVPNISKRVVVVSCFTRFSPKTIIFSDSFESGDFSAWPTTYISSCSMSVVNTRSHHGTYSQQISNLRQYRDRAWARRVLPGGPYTALYARAYYMFVGTLPNATNSWWDLCPIFDANSEVTEVNGNFPIFSFANNKWGIRYSVNDSTYGNIWEIGTSTPPQVNTWFCIELYCNITTHTLILWIDGVQKLSTSVNFRNDCLNAVDAFAYVERAENANRTIAIDCFVVSDSYIGRCCP